MNTAFLMLAAPILGMLILAVIKNVKLSGILNITFSSLSFGGALLLLRLFTQHGNLIFVHGQFYFDAFSLLLILLTTFVSLTTAVFSYSYMNQNLSEKRITPKHLRFYHSLYQAFIAAMLLVLVSGNIGIIWVAMEGATLATVLLVSLYRSPEAIEAAWKYFIICIVGIALALFGTVLVYFAAQNNMQNGDAILWQNLYAHASVLNGSVLALALVFLFVGYGTKIGLVPMHHWLPDAHSESPGPMSTLLSGLLLNVALYALLRFKMIIDQSAVAHSLANHLMLIFGIISLLYASIALHRQTSLKRMFSYSSIAHMGVITFAFGLGTHAAVYAGLLYMLTHALVKSAAFTTAANIIHLYHTQKINHIRGLKQVSPIFGWLLTIAILILAGLPPSGLFTAEVLLIIAIAKIHPWLLPMLGVGLIIAFAALLKYLQAMVYTQNFTELTYQPNRAKAISSSWLPAAFHLSMVIFLGFNIPPLIANLLNSASSLIARQL